MKSYQPKELEAIVSHFYDQIVNDPKNLIGCERDKYGVPILELKVPEDMISPVFSPCINVKVAKHKFNIFELAAPNSPNYPFNSKHFQIQ